MTFLLDWTCKLAALCESTHYRRFCQFPELSCASVVFLFFQLFTRVLYYLHVILLIRKHWNVIKIVPRQKFFSTMFSSNSFQVNINMTTLAAVFFAQLVRAMWSNGRMPWGNRLTSNYFLSGIACDVGLTILLQGIMK